MTSLYHPKDNSLSEKIHGFRTSLNALRQIETSLTLATNEDWAQSLGEKQELDSAHQVCRESLDMAIQNILPNEMQQAVTENLIDATETKSYMQAQRVNEIRNSREQNEQDISKSKGPDFDSE